MLQGVLRFLQVSFVMSQSNAKTSLPRGFKLLEVPASRAGNTDGITYLVTDDGTVIFTREYVRHRTLLGRTHFPFYNIDWGGVLTDHGEWVRRSYDFGDAPDPESREAVITLIKRSLSRPRFLEPRPRFALL